jgi:predicted MFS family arabinose efflux permease
MRGRAPRRKDLRLSQQSNVEPLSGAAPATEVGRLLLIAIQAAVFMVAAGAQLMTPLLPAIADDFRATVASAGLLISAYALPYGLFQLVYGPLADRFSRQRVMGVALTLFALGMFASGIAPSLAALTWLRVITGAVAAGIIPVALAFIGDVVPYDERQATLGRVISVASLGGVLSAALGGLIATLLSWRALFFGYGLVALAVAVLLLRQPLMARTGGSGPSGLRAYGALFRGAGGRALALYALVFVEGVAATGMAGFLGAFLRERAGLSYAAIGALLTINGVASMLVARQAGWLVRRLRERGMLLFGGGLMTVAYLLAPLPPTLLLFPLAAALMGSGFVIAHSTLQARATELAPTMRGTAVALFAFSLFIGGALGTLFAAQAIERLGYEAALLGTAALLALFTAVSVPLLRVIQRPAPAEDRRLTTDD